MTEQVPGPVRWADLKPDEFVRRRDEVPVCYLPMGLCEPHGHVAALGLDTHKADWLCERAAERAGGVVAPTQGYHVHESGFHARWLHDEVGDTQAGLLALPAHIVCQVFVHQLRGIRNAGFAAAVAVTGHVGGSERDLRRWGDAFAERFDLRVIVMSDVDLSSEPGDHAGRYELSALMHVRPDLVDLDLLDRWRHPDAGGRLALGDTAAEASAEYGAIAMNSALGSLVELVRELDLSQSPAREPLAYGPVDALAAELLARADTWESVRPRPGQEPVPAGSWWASYEHVTVPPPSLPSSSPSPSPSLPSSEAHP